MKYFAVVLLAVACVFLADAKPLEQNVESIEPTKTEAAEPEVRDKRSFLVSSAYTAPVAYSAYTAPVAYTAAAYSYPYAYSAYAGYPYYASAYSSPYLLA